MASPEGLTISYESISSFLSIYSTLETWIDLTQLFEGKEGRMERRKGKEEKEENTRKEERKNNKERGNTTNKEEKVYNLGKQSYIKKNIGSRRKAKFEDV